VAEPIAIRQRGKALFEKAFHDDEVVQPKVRGDLTQLTSIGVGEITLTVHVDRGIRFRHALVTVEGVEFCFRIKFGEERRHEYGRTTFVTAELDDVLRFQAAKTVAHQEKEVHQPLVIHERQVFGPCMCELIEFVLRYVLCKVRMV